MMKEDFHWEIISHLGLSRINVLNDANMSRAYRSRVSHGCDRVEEIFKTGILWNTTWICHPHHHTFGHFKFHCENLTSHLGFRNHIWYVSRDLRPRNATMFESNVTGCQHCIKLPITSLPRSDKHKPSPECHALVATECYDHNWCVGESELGFSTTWIRQNKYVSIFSNVWKRSVTVRHRKRWTDGKAYLDSNVHGANIGPIWDRQDPGGPHVGPMNLIIRVGLSPSPTDIHIMTYIVT